MNCRQAQWQDNVIRIIRIWIVWSIILNHTEANRTVQAQIQSAVNHLFFHMCTVSSDVWVTSPSECFRSCIYVTSTDHILIQTMTFIPFCTVLSLMDPTVTGCGGRCTLPDIRDSFEVSGVIIFGMSGRKTDLGAPRSVHKRHRPGCVGLFVD